MRPARLGAAAYRPGPCRRVGTDARCVVAVHGLGQQGNGLAHPRPVQTFSRASGPGAGSKALRITCPNRPHPGLEIGCIQLCYRRRFAGRSRLSPRGRIGRLQAPGRPVTTRSAGDWRCVNRRLGVREVQLRRPCRETGVVFDVAWFGLTSDSTRFAQSPKR